MKTSRRKKVALEFAKTKQDARDLIEETSVMLQDFPGFSQWAIIMVVRSARQHIGRLKRWRLEFGTHLRECGRFEKVLTKNVRRLRRQLVELEERRKLQ